MPDESASLNEYQQRRLRVTCEHVDRLLADVEGILDAAASAAAFPRYIPDVLPAQRRVLEDYIARARAQLIRILEGQAIPRPTPNIPAGRAIRTTLTFVDIAAEELAPNYMRGYGELSPRAEGEINGIIGELKSLIAQMDRIVADTGPDLADRLERLAQTDREVELLRKLERIVAQRALVEFRPVIEGILDRLEDRRLEIGIFGRVSSGKSSLLNAILEQDVLPVGVTPITAVPTRIGFGLEPMVSVWYVDRPRERLPLARLAELVSERENPGNAKHVSRIVAWVPAARLREGVIFVDTPGVGSLAARGAAETLAYLPRCDLGVVLVDAASTLTAEDINLAHALLEAATPISVLLSKADLISPADRQRSIEYIGRQMEAELHVRVPVWPVSTAGEHRALMEAWFVREIRPLYERRHELKTASLKRKIGALRQAVAAALRARLRREGPSAVSAVTVRAVEDGLRQAAGRFEEARQAARRQTEALARSLGSFTHEAAAAVARAKPEPPAPGDLARQAILAAVQREVAALFERLQTLAREQAAALSENAAQLGAADTPTAAELASGLRELPVAEIDASGWAVRPASLSRWLGRRFVVAALARQIEREGGERLRQALEIYSRMIDEWASRTITAMESAFNSYADTYRAQAQRMLAGEVGADGNQQEIESALQEIVAVGAERA